MADIIDFPGGRKNDRPESQLSSANDCGTKGSARKEKRSNDRIAHAILYWGLGMSAIAICAGHVYHGTRMMYKRLRRKR